MKKKKTKSTCDPLDRRCFFVEERTGTCDRHLAQAAQQARTNYARMGYPEIYRAAGDKLCDVCGKPYYDHPVSQQWLDQDGDPWVNQICNGDVVKL